MVEMLLALGYAALAAGIVLAVIAIVRDRQR